MLRCSFLENINLFVDTETPVSREMRLNIRRILYIIFTVNEKLKVARLIRLN